MQRLSIKKVAGPNGRGFSLRDENGNKYWKHQMCKDGYSVRCSLWRSNCPARGKMLNAEPNTIILNTVHHHNVDRELLMEFKNILHQRAKSERLSLRAIYNEVSALQRFTNVSIGPYESHRRQMARTRRAHQPPNPRSMYEFKQQLESPTYFNLMMVQDQPFFHGSIGTTDEEGITLVFVTPHVRNIFRTSTEFFIDGTFNAAPRFGVQCQQLFVLMGISYDVGFPLVYALMSRKTEQAYKALFLYIKTLEPTWQPTTVMTDFERASIKAINSVFPTTRIVGCWFHSSQSLWRKIQELGLTNLYRQNRKVHDFFRMVMAIALLPNQKLNEGFDEVRRMYRMEIQNFIGRSENENIQKFLEYYSRTWLTGIFADMLSVSHQNRRTNNVLEISHRNLMTHIQNPNPSPWLFLENLITHVHGIINDYRLVVDGIEVRQPRPRASNEQDRKITLGLTKLGQNRFTVAEFLGYTKHVTPNFGVERPNVHNEELQEQDVEPIINNVEPVINIVDNIELQEQDVEPIINNVEPVINIVDNIELQEQDVEPIINIVDNIGQGNRVILGYESPPPFFQGVLRHYNLPLLVPLPIYSEEDARPDDVWHEFPEHNEGELDNEIVPYGPFVVDNIEPLVWPTFEFDPQPQINTHINGVPHIEIRRSNDEVENMREIVVCVACMSTGSNIVLRPCNHVCLCGGCFQELDRLVCPLCRSIIREIVVILD